MTYGNRSRRGVLKSRRRTNCSGHNFSGLRRILLLEIRTQLHRTRWNCEQIASPDMEPVGVVEAGGLFNSYFTCQSTRIREAVEGLILQATDC
ncbi:hypothetical protein PM082_009323 [Marasmius tenuissimus]|nr:hypothetical protein PM082_009323 [Marasmius tenuissimus]